ncbi:hypothetical protein AB6A40_009120 [Gnathostoma spinigerum]|uniref:Choline/carnitine acyltransferase domain-containing protein n=1 Tax=Gnathostoma spinigerum TaxID=75299 RepID=A0ABD6ESW2_9BILA
MLNTAIKRSRGDSWQEEEVTITPPKKLEFDIDDEIRETIDHCAQAFQKLKSSVAVKTIYFREYGNAYLKTKHIYGDTVVQMALQLAFYRTHHR